MAFFLGCRCIGGIDARDTKLLEALLADPFSWIHCSDGRVDDRATWLASAARGMALSGQRMARTDHGATLLHGDPANVAVRISRVRLAASYGEWRDASLLATFPNGAQAQVFLVSPSEEAARNPVAGGLHFTLDEHGEPTSAALVRAGQEAWRAARRGKT